MYYADGLYPSRRVLFAEFVKAGIRKPLALREAVLVLFNDAVPPKKEYFITIRFNNPHEVTAGMIVRIHGNMLSNTVE